MDIFWNHTLINHKAGLHFPLVEQENFNEYDEYDIQ